MTAFVVQGDGIVLTGDSKSAHKTAHFCRRYRNRVVIPTAAVDAVVAQRGASVAIPHRYYRLRENRLYPRKINPTGLASIATGIPPAALLVGQKPEPTYGEPPLPIVPPHSPYGQEV